MLVGGGQAHIYRDQDWWLPEVGGRGVKGVKTYKL